MDDNTTHSVKRKKKKPVKLCKEFLETGSCEWGEHCRYSHGEETQREDPQTVPEDLHVFMDDLSVNATKKRQDKPQRLVPSSDIAESSRATLGPDLTGKDSPTVVETTERKPWILTKKTRTATVPPLRSQTPTNDGLDAVSAFYAQYPDFDYTAMNGPCAEFYRLSDVKQWSRFGKEQKEARSAFQTALVDLFNERYGTDVDSLENWQKVCVVLNFWSPPSTVEECQALIMPLHFNIVDMLGTLDQEIPVFPSRHKMHEYTTKSRKYFPSNHPYAGALLKFLLKEL